MMSPLPIYHNMLVSPRLGGGEKVGIEIHRYVASRRPRLARLLVPARSMTESVVAEQHLQFSSYNLPWLMGNRRGAALAANAQLIFRVRAGAHGVLHVHSPFVYGALRPFLSISKIRTIVHLHLDYSEAELAWALRRAPDVVVTCAGFMRKPVEKLLSASAAATRIVVAINAVDTERFVPGDRALAKQAADAPAGQPVLLMAANLAPHKGQATAIRALATLTRRGYRPALWLVGEERQSGGNYTRELHNLVSELGVSDCVKFLGFRTDMPELLRAADYLLLPSTHEGLPLSILEAQASRSVVIAAPTAGIPEVVEDGRTGFLVAADNPTGYADRIETLMKESALAESVRDVAHRQVIARFTLKSYCEGILSVYDGLLAGAPLLSGNAS